MLGILVWIIGWEILNFDSSCLMVVLEGIKFFWNVLFGRIIMVDFECKMEMGINNIKGN